MCEIRDVQTRYLSHLRDDRGGERVTKDMFLIPSLPFYYHSIRVCVCVYISMCVCVCSYIYVCVCVYISMCVCVHISTCVCVSLFRSYVFYYSVALL